MSNFYEYVKTAFGETPTKDNQKLVDSISNEKLGEIGLKLYDQENYLNPQRQLIDDKKALGVDLLLPYDFKKAGISEFCPILNNVTNCSNRHLSDTIIWSNDTTSNQLNHLKSVLLLSHRVTLTSPLNSLRLLVDQILTKEVEVYLRKELVCFLNLIHHLAPLIIEGIVRFVPENLLSQQSQLGMLKNRMKDHKKSTADLIEYAEENKFELTQSFKSKGRNYLDDSAFVKYSTGLALSAPYESHYLKDTYGSFLEQYYYTSALDSSPMFNNPYWLKMLKLLNEKQSSHRLTKTVEGDRSIDGLNELMRLSAPDTSKLLMNDMVNIRMNDMAFSKYRETLIEGLLTVHVIDDNPKEKLSYIINKLNYGKSTLEVDMKNSGLLKKMLGIKANITFNLLVDSLLTGGIKTALGMGSGAAEYIGERSERKIMEAHHQHYAIWSDG